MNKTNKLLIIKIVILSIVAFLLLGIMIILLNKTNIVFNKVTSTNKTIYEKTYQIPEINSIKVNSISTDIHIEESSNNQIEVLISGQNEKEVDVSLRDNNLEITTEKHPNLCIGFCFSDTSITVKLPASYNRNLELKTTSGDINIGSFSNLNPKIKTTSGDIKILEVNNLTSKTTSGDISIKKANTAKITSTSGDLEAGMIATYLDLKTTSGDIEIDNLTLTQNSIIKTTSGDIEIDMSTDIYVEAKTRSGNTYIKTNNRYAKIELKIESISGSITVGED